MNTRGAIGAIGAMLLYVVAAPVAAAEPSRTNRVACAVHTSVCARADVSTNHTRVTTAAAGARSPKVLWVVGSWLYVLAVSEDGSALLAAVEPYGQLPSGSGPKHVVLQVYAKGALQQEITVADLYPSSGAALAALRQQYWGRLRGSEYGDAFRIELLDGRIAQYNLRTLALSFE